MDVEDMAQTAVVVDIDHTGRIDAAVVGRGNCTGA
jgi:hypothetical protein